MMCIVYTTGKDVVEQKKGEYTLMARSAASRKYQLTITAVHTSGSFDKTYEFDLTDDESKFIKGNIDNLLVAHIAEQYKLFLPMRTITKAYKEKV